MTVKILNQIISLTLQLITPSLQQRDLKVTNYLAKFSHLGLVSSILALHAGDLGSNPRGAKFQQKQLNIFIHNRTYQRSTKVLTGRLGQCVNLIIREGW